MTHNVFSYGYILECVSVDISIFGVAYQGLAHVGQVSSTPVDPNNINKWKSFKGIIGWRFVDMVACPHKIYFVRYNMTVTMVVSIVMVGGLPTQPLVFIYNFTYGVGGSDLPLF